jgi:hypothetical protein
MMILALADVDDGGAREQIVNASPIFAKNKTGIDDEVKESYQGQVADNTIDQDTQYGNLKKIGRFAGFKIDNLTLHTVFADRLTPSREQEDLQREVGYNAEQRQTDSEHQR